MSPTQTKGTVTQDQAWTEEEGAEGAPYEKASINYPDMSGAEEIGDNVLYQVSGGMLHIMVDLSQRWGPAKSGQSTIIATSRGIKPLPGTEQPGAGGKVSLGFNVFTPIDTKPRKTRKSRS